MLEGPGLLQILGFGLLWFQAWGFVSQGLVIGVSVGNLISTARYPEPPKPLN